MPKSSGSSGSKSRSEARHERRRENQDDQKSCLYIGNIDKRFTEDKLRELFEQYGELDYCYIVYEPFTSSQNYSKEIKMSRGYGFAKFKLQNDSIKAKNELNGFSINGREIKVQLSKRNRPREATPGRYLGRVRVSPNRRPRYQRPRSYSSSSSRSRRREKHQKRRHHHHHKQRSRSRSRSYEKDRYRNKRRSYSNDRNQREYRRRSKQ